MRCPGAWLILAALLPSTASPQAQDDPGPMDQEGIAFFEEHVRPVLIAKCYSCHSTKAGKAKAKLYLDSRAGMLRGGESGPALVARKPEESLILKVVDGSNEDLVMPPKKEKRLSANEVGKLRLWIKMGAPDPRRSTAPAPPPSFDFARARNEWPFRDLSDPTLPSVKRLDWIRTPVDRFILARLEAKGLAPVEDADKRALIRRATFDLIGLPPTPEEIDAFLEDPSSDAFDRVIERLLASPHYGEQWGRHWLDVVRYADTAGDNSDYPIPQHYRYRNYVIDSFNEDKPYDQFILEQLAGDRLKSTSEKDRHRNLIATGYLANSRRHGSRVKDYPWHLTVEDTIDNLGRTFLALTINCSRCHDHKFDPLTNQDYYALYGFFSSTRYPWPGIELDKVPRDMVALCSEEERERNMKPRRARQKEFDAKVKSLEARKKAAGKKPPKKLEDELKKAKKERDAFRKKALPYPTAYAVVDAKKTGDAPVQIRGQPHNRGREVRRAFPKVLGGRTLPANVKDSGRLHLARWIADRENPLTARVMVNRIWATHFGRGIVATPSNFGKQGQPPSHPELLDWLASRFIESGWSVKAMHRLLMKSRVYGLSSRDRGENVRQDPTNALLWKFNRHRLRAEAIRDALLAIGDGLDRTRPEGPHPFPAQETWGFTQHNPFKAVYPSNRRSVYLMIQRIQAHPFLGIFDGADPNASTPKRGVSTTPLQALYFINSAFVHEQASRFAARLLRERPDRDARIERAYRLTLGRPPGEEEKRRATAFLDAAYGTLKNEQKTWESYARVLFRLNEFVYVD